MRRVRMSLAVLLFAVACAGPGASRDAGVRPSSEPRSEPEVLSAQRGWWTAFATGDAAYLKAHTAPALTLTLSSGRTYDLAGALAQLAPGSTPRIEWAEERVHFSTPDTAVVSSRCTESAGTFTGTFRYLTVLQRAGEGWRILAAQSTREAALTPRVSGDVAGPLVDFAGSYRTPRGGLLRVAVGGAALLLIEPSGKELPLEPIGPGLFEFAQLSPGNGIVRFSFSRSAAGEVTAFNRLINGRVDTFPRVQTRESNSGAPGTP